MATVADIEALRAAAGTTEETIAALEARIEQIQQERFRGLTAAEAATEPELVAGVRRAAEAARQAAEDAANHAAKTAQRHAELEHGRIAAQAALEPHRLRITAAKPDMDAAAQVSTDWATGGGDSAAAARAKLTEVRQRADAAGLMNLKLVAFFEAVQRHAGLVAADEAATAAEEEARTANEANAAAETAQKLAEARLEGVLEALRFNKSLQFVVEAQQIMVAPRPDASKSRTPRKVRCPSPRRTPPRR